LERGKQRFQHQVGKTNWVVPVTGPWNCKIPWSKHLSHRHGVRFAVHVCHLVDFDPQRSVLLDEQYIYKYGLFLEIRNHVVHSLQDVVHRPPLGRHMELSVDHAVRFHTDQRPAQTHTGSLATTFGVVYDHILDHVLNGHVQLPGNYLGIRRG